MSTIPFKPFKTNSAVPIIGQAFTVNGGFATTVIQCGCEAKAPVLLIGASPSQCPACGRAFGLASLAFDAMTGQIQVQIGLARVEPPGVPS